MKKYPPNFFIVGVRNQFNSSPERKKFVPFVQQRDGLGRLIKTPSSSSQNQGIVDSSSKILASQNMSTSRQLLQSKAENMQQTINDLFQINQHKIKLIKQQNSSIRVRKNIYTLKRAKTQGVFLGNLLANPNENKQFNIRYITSTSPQHALQTRSSSNKLLKNLSTLGRSEIRQNKTRKTQSLVKQKELQLIVPSNSPKININKNYDSLKSQKQLLAFQENKIKQQTHIIELKRYHRFKALSLKLFDDIPKGNSIFFQKILQSKKMSFKLKMNIEST